MWRKKYLRGISSVSRPRCFVAREKSFRVPPILLRSAFLLFTYMPIIFFSTPTAEVRSSTTMKLFFPLFAAAIAAPVSAEFYIKEQFNDDVSFVVL